MQTSAMRACSYIAECSLSYAKIMQGECSSKAVKRSFTRLDIAEPKLILYAKIMQGECSSKAVKRSFTRLDIAEPKLILCKDSYLIY